MGREVTIHIKIGRREFLAALVLGLLVAGPRPLSTETLTLNTYYPSPYGVYNQIRSTQDAYLAYGGGNVNIGTLAPAVPAAKLQVTGNGNVVLTPTGNVGIGTANPVKKLHLSGGGPNQDIVFDPAGGMMAIGTTDTSPIYGTAIKVKSGNIHVQGNENASYLRVGDAWGYDGIYSEGGDLILGSANGPIHVGPPGGDGQYLAGMCKSVWYSYPAMTTCPNTGIGWSVMGWGTVAGNIDNTTPIPLAGFMTCCKLQTP